MSARAWGWAIVLPWLAMPALAGVTEDLAVGKIPLYPGAKPHAVKVATGVEAIATVRADLGEVLGFYRRELARTGWQDLAPSGVLDQDLDKVPLAILLYRRGERSLRIVIAERSPSTTTIWVGDEGSRPRERRHGQPAR